MPETRGFTIVTNRQTAENMVKVLNSVAFDIDNRSIRLGNVSHYEGYSEVRINAVGPDTLIKPEDIFFLGLYTGRR